MDNGDMVRYKGDNYIIIHNYKNGYCEIRKSNENYKVELVSTSELELLQKKNEEN